MAKFNTDNLSIFHTFSKTQVNSDTSTAYSTLANTVNKSGHTVQSNEIWTEEIPFFGEAGDLTALHTDFSPYARTNDLVKVGKQIYIRNATKYTSGATRESLWSLKDTHVTSDVPNEDGSYPTASGALANGCFLLNAAGKPVVKYHERVTLTPLVDSNNAFIHSQGDASRLKVGGAWVEQFIGVTDSYVNGSASVGYKPAIYATAGETTPMKGGPGLDYLDYCATGIILWDSKDCTGSEVINCFEYVGKKLATSISSIQTEIDAINGQLGGGVGENSIGSRLTEVEDDIKTLTGTGDGSVSKTVSDAIDEILGSYDTVADAFSVYFDNKQLNFTKNATKDSNGFYLYQSNGKITSAGITPAAVENGVILEGNNEFYLVTAGDAKAIAEKVAKDEVGKIVIPEVNKATDSVTGTVKVTTGAVAKDATDTSTDPYVVPTVGALAATRAAIEQRITDLHVAGVSYYVTDTLPTVPAGKESEFNGRIYLVLTGKDGVVAADGSRIEYMYVNEGTDEVPSWDWEQIGTTTTDLSGYVQSSELDAYAKTTDLDAYAKSTDLDAYVKSTDLSTNAVTGITFAGSDTTHTGVVNIGKRIDDVAFQTHIDTASSTNVSAEINGSNVLVLYEATAQTPGLTRLGDKDIAYNRDITANDYGSGIQSLYKKTAASVYSTQKAMYAVYAYATGTAQSLTALKQEVVKSVNGIAPTEGNVLVKIDDFINNRVLTDDEINPTQWANTIAVSGEDTSERYLYNRISTDDNYGVVKTFYGSYSALAGFSDKSKYLHHAVSVKTFEQGLAHVQNASSISVEGTDTNNLVIGDANGFYSVPGSNQNNFNFNSTTGLFVDAAFGSGGSTTVKVIDGYIGSKDTYGNICGGDYGRFAAIGSFTSIYNDTPRSCRVEGNFLIDEETNKVAEVLKPERFISSVSIDRTKCNLKSWVSDMPNLKDGNRVFYFNDDLTTFIGDLSSLENAYEMFYGCDALTTFIGDLSSLSNGDRMFSTFGGSTSTSAKLNSESVECILESIPDWTGDGVGHNLDIGVSTVITADSDVRQSIKDITGVELTATVGNTQVITYKGWEITFFVSE